MHVADREDGSDCGVQDPDQDCEEEAGVADLRSLTGSATAGFLRAGVGRVYRRRRPGQGP